LGGPSGGYDLPNEGERPATMPIPAGATHMYIGIVGIIVIILLLILVF